MIITIIDQDVEKQVCKADVVKSWEDDKVTEHDKSNTIEADTIWQARKWMTCVMHLNNFEQCDMGKRKSKPRCFEISETDSQRELSSLFQHRYFALALIWLEFINMLANILNKVLWP